MDFCWQSNVSRFELIWTPWGLYFFFPICYLTNRRHYNLQTLFAKSRSGKVSLLWHIELIKLILLYLLYFVERDEQRLPQDLWYGCLREPQKAKCPHRISFHFLHSDLSQLQMYLPAYVCSRISKRNFKMERWRGSNNKMHKKLRIMFYLGDLLRA